MSTKRLEILESSLAKKNAEFDKKLSSHFASVRATNGQPLNDKRNGAATLDAWDRQNNSLRTLDASIKKTAHAIEREKGRISHVEAFTIPECLCPLVASGAIRQWRKHPRFFFVEGVEKARIVVRDDGILAHKFVKEIPTQDQYAIFRSVFNAANASQRAASIESGREKA